MCLAIRQPTTILGMEATPAPHTQALAGSRARLRGLNATLFITTVHQLCPATGPSSQDSQWGSSSCTTATCILRARGAGGAALDQFVPSGWKGQWAAWREREKKTCFNKYPSSALTMPRVFQLPNPYLTSQLSERHDCM